MLSDCRAQNLHGTQNCSTHTHNGSELKLLLKSLVIYVVVFSYCYGSRTVISYNADTLKHCYVRAVETWSILCHGFPPASYFNAFKREVSLFLHPISSLLLAAIYYSTICRNFSPVFALAYVLSAFWRGAPRRLLAIPFCLLFRVLYKLFTAPAPAFNFPSLFTFLPLSCRGSSSVYQIAASLELIFAIRFLFYMQGFK